MTQDPLALGQLLVSRICHDLISPIGAMHNGIELLSLVSDTSGEEMQLLSESTTAAQARLKLFRVAFGASDADTPFSTGELRALAREITATSRVAFDFTGDTVITRLDVQIALLCYLCLETAAPFGGEVLFSIDDQINVSLTAQNIDITKLNLIRSDIMKMNPRPAQVQFLFLPLMLQRHGLALSLHEDANSVTLRADRAIA
jgi:histidine phosphotransferase ChpT